MLKNHRQMNPYGKQVLCFLFLLCLASNAFAIFREHQIIQPGTANENLRPIITEYAEGKVLVKLPADAKIDSLKTPRLMVCKTPLDFSQPATGLKGWNGSEPFIELFMHLSKSSNPRLGTTDQYAVILNEAMIERSYIYIDFQNPMLIDDGGYYYTIDLPAFYKEYKKSAQSE